MNGLPTPRECPDARLDMIRGLNPGGAHYEIIQRRCDPESDLYLFELAGRKAQDEAAWLQDHLYKTELYWMRSDIVQLINQNVCAIEPSTTLDPTYVPARCGLVFIQDGAIPHYNKAPTPGDIPVHAFTWERCDDSFVTSAWICEMSEWVISGGDVWIHDRRLDDFEREHSEILTNQEIEMYREPRMFLRRWMLSMFAFLKTPRVVTADRRPADRHTAKRSQRAGLDLNDTHVIYLRTASHPTGNGTGEDRYHHRWIVSGHWRSQPYGPRSERRRPIWIMPHLKGPEGAPLLGGDKVRAVIR